jgi:hypothetical protein
MGFGSSRKYRSLPATAILALTLVWTAGALGLDMQVGGGRPLQLSNLPIVYQETFDPGKDPARIFWGLLDLGTNENDPWTGRLDNGGYELIHNGRAGAVRYYYKQPPDPPAASASNHQALSVEVGGGFADAPSGAGLLYAFDSETGHYFAFVLGQGQSYAIYRRNEEGLRRIFGGTSEAVSPGRFNQLAIVPRGPKTDFYVNGTHVAGLGIDPGPGAAVGLVAISAGDFIFDNFTLYKVPQ